MPIYFSKIMPYYLLSGNILTYIIRGTLEGKYFSYKDICFPFVA